MTFRIVLHNVRSVYNVGSIFRTADAVGAEKIFLCGITPEPYDRLGNMRKDFAKVALGGEKYLSWEHIKSTARTINVLKKEGWLIFAIEQSKKSVPYYKSISSVKDRNKDQRKLALILGDEVRGLPPSILKLADKVLEIPMSGAMVRDAAHPKRSGKGKESLNVAISFGIVAFGLRYLADTDE